MDKRFSANSSGDSTKNGHNSVSHTRAHRNVSRTTSLDVFDLACKVCNLSFRLLLHVENA